MINAAKDYFLNKMLVSRFQNLIKKNRFNNAHQTVYHAIASLEAVSNVMELSNYAKTQVFVLAQPGHFMMKSSLSVVLAFKIVKLVQIGKNALLAPRAFNSTLMGNFVQVSLTKKLLTVVRIKKQKI